MRTENVIQSLAGELVPVPRHAVRNRLAIGIGAGAVLSVLVMLFWLGIRPDLSQAMKTTAYWLKFFFTGLLGILAFWATARLARPGMRAGRALAGVAIVYAALFLVALAQMMHAPANTRMTLVMGHSAQVCPWRIAILSIPIFIGTVWSLRALAPIRLTLAGATAGFAAGALGAWIYAFHCNESAAPFLLVFYTLGIALLGATGALMARPLLRW